MSVHLFQLGPIPENVMGGYYNYNLVFLSYIVAILASFVALEIAQRIRQEKFSIFWLLIGGAFAMGAGIFTMHFVGMLAFKMEMPMSYNFFLTLLSILIAIVASGFAFYLVRDPFVKIGDARFILGGVVLGSAIASMHYVGMTAMEGMHIAYLPGLFCLSIVVAVVASLAALFLMIACEKGTPLQQKVLKTISALVMGAAICGMHYIGMEAAVMTPSETPLALTAEASFLSPEKLSFVVTFVAASIMLIALLLTGYKHLIVVKLITGFLIAPLLLIPLTVIFLQNIQTANQLSESMAKEVFPRIPSISDTEKNALKLQLKEWDDKNKAEGEDSKNLFLLITGSIFLFSLATGLLTAIQISQPILRVRNASRKIAEGDLNEIITIESSDEIGQLGVNFNHMISHLKQTSDALTAVSCGDLTIDVRARSDEDSLGLALANMVKNLRHITGEIQTEVTHLTTSSHEIVNSVSQIALSSAETASAISETTTSIEELKQTAHVSNEKAKDVLYCSKETLEIVNTSQKLLETTMEEMKQISDKMRIISEGIVTLKDNSQTIGKIINTVNNLAEQSNLLAVNAAIEAAKAGEHGKSFVVIAQEIKALAEQSKSATIQVRSILNDIQSSTTAAALATEQGANAVEKGVIQSVQTNESIHNLSQSVTRVTQAANQIALSSQQQFIGVDQVTAAMNNISHSTTQLVDHMKQIATAVTHLNAIGENLKNMTDHYTLSK